MFPRTLATLAVLILVAPAVYADVLVVDFFGGGDFLTIQEAVDGAQDGDIILVRESAAQPAFTVDGKSDEVIADTPGLVFIYGGNIRIENLSPDQSVTIANFSSFGDLCLPNSPSALLQHGLSAP